ncbi:hypothetical protein [Castellaniella sp.]|uniref:hypothetical protein n=1 Tax=Castellaniella sp. TaxID=1955812 RepID=UPI002AFFA93E|nr:hypothetical protein [Castellaniella sp.]
MDQNLVNFAADVDWAKQNGARSNASTWHTTPLRRKPDVKGFLQRSGQRRAPVWSREGPWPAAPQPKRIDPLAASRRPKPRHPKPPWRPPLNRIPCTSDPPPPLFFTAGARQDLHRLATAQLPQASWLLSVPTRPNVGQAANARKPHRRSACRIMGTGNDPRQPRNVPDRKSAQRAWPER